MTSQDRRFSDRELMQRAMLLARSSVSEEGRVSPKVGAVLARDGVVIGEASRVEFEAGEHAEFTLLEKKLGDDLVAGATLFTTLEPCTAPTLRSGLAWNASLTGGSQRS